MAKIYPIASAASALFRATAPASAPSGGTVAVPPWLSGSLSLPPENLETKSTLFFLPFTPRIDQGLAQGVSALPC